MSVLSGIKVIELANERISWAGKLMGDMGADVILVEPEEGEATLHFSMINLAKIEASIFGTTTRANAR